MAPYVRGAYILEPMRADLTTGHSFSMHPGQKGLYYTGCTFQLTLQSLVPVKKVIHNAYIINNI